jgi:hypothetical protein
MALNRIKELIKMASVGKFDRGLYYNGERFQSSFAGGLVTLTFAIALMVYSVSMFYSILTKDEYRMD